MSFSENEKQWKLCIRKEQNIHIRVFFVLFCYFWWEICMLRKHTRWGKHNLGTCLWRAAVEASKGTYMYFFLIFTAETLSRSIICNLRNDHQGEVVTQQPAVCRAESLSYFTFEIASALICTLPHRVYLTGTRICENTVHYSSDPVSSCTSSRALRNYHSQPCGCTKCLMQLTVDLRMRTETNKWLKPFADFWIFNMPLLLLPGHFFCCGGCLDFLFRAVYVFFLKREIKSVKIIFIAFSLKNFPDIKIILLFSSLGIRVNRII